MAYDWYWRKLKCSMRDFTVKKCIMKIREIRKIDEGLENDALLYEKIMIFLRCPTVYLQSSEDREMWYFNLSALKLLIDLHFNEIQGKSVDPPFLDQPPPFRFLSPFFKNFWPTFSVNFGKFHPSFRKREVRSYERAMGYIVWTS